MFRNPTTDLIVVLVIVLLIFGPKRLPGLGRSLGQGLREFKDSITGGSSDEDTEDEERSAIAAAPASPPASVPATAPAAPGSATAPGAASAPEREPVEAQPTGRGDAR